MQPMTPSRPVVRRRLTDQERALRAVSEADLQRQVIDLAVLLGYEWAHFRHAPSRKDNLWRVPVAGPLGKGWPDLVLVRTRDRRHLVVELKRETGDLSPDQERVLALLTAGGIEVHVWRPSDLADPIERSVVFRVLRGGRNG